MNKLELENRLKQENLLTVYDNDVKKTYIDGEKLIDNGVRQNALNVFGCYKSEKKHVIFITDDERGLPTYIDRFETEEDACQALYDYIILLKRIHDKGL